MFDRQEWIEGLAMSHWKFDELPVVRLGNLCVIMCAQSRSNC